MIATNAPIAFDFENTPVRVVMIDDQPWWAGKDVCACLEIENHKTSLARLDDDERRGSTVWTPSGEQMLTCINEPGLYRLIFTSRKDAAERFKRWLAHDVLPALRRTGSYTMPGTAPHPPAGVMEDEHLTRWSLGLATVREARRLYGNTVARRMWPRLGLPDPQLPVARIADAPPETPEEKILAVLQKRDDGTGMGRCEINSYTRDLDRAARRIALKALVDAGLIEMRREKARNNTIDRFYLIEGED